MVKRHAQKARFPDGIGKTDLHTIAIKNPLWGLVRQYPLWGLVRQYAFNSAFNIFKQTLV